MANIAAHIHSRRENDAVAVPTSKATGRWDIRVGNDLGAYLEACRNAHFAPPQSPSWIKAWAENTKLEILVATIQTPDGEPALALALEVAEIGPFKVAHFVGDKHANGNFPASSPRFLDQIGANGLHDLVKAVRRARPDIDVISLERLAESHDGKPNPLLLLNHSPSPNIALAAGLTGGFQKLVERTGGSRKLKKHRRQERKFAEAGVVRRFTAATSQEVDRLLSGFFDMKAQRFAALGIANAFEPETVRASLRALFLNALASAAPPFTLEGLEIDGRLRAVTGHSRDGARLVCEFCAFADDELTPLSPGSYLFFELIRAACENGYAVYDFSVGDEAYKRQWCELEIRQFDVVLPLTAKGRAYVAWAKARSSLKRRVKANPVIWGYAKQLRRALRGS